MSPISIAISNELLAHHRFVCQLRNDVFPPRDECVITYGELCERAGVLELTRYVGRHLQEVAEWCVRNGYPPLNSLAVNQDSRMPGDNYNLAPGCSLFNWPTLVDVCIRFRGYPNAVPRVP